VTRKVGRILYAIWRVFARSFILAGLPMLAWGLGDLASFFANPVRVVYVLLVIGRALVLAWLWYICPPEPEQESQVIIGHYHADIFEFLYILAAYNDRHGLLAMPDLLAIRWSGLAIFFLGTVIALWAQATWVFHLRVEMDHTGEHPVLLQKGPYWAVRYPKLLALFLECLGIALIFRSWAGLVMLLPLVASILNLTGVMEKFFSKQYYRVWGARAYTSKKLLPFIY
jgi:protein-S-isoprenylcysteine O-methyltransferase Ste14